jgi:hypothetical protein
LEVDESKCLIRNVCILGPKSRNRNRYTTQAMEGAVDLYRNAKSFVNHPSDPKGRRDFQARLGTIKDPRLENGRIYGDYFYNPEHEDAKKLVWAAKNDPDFGGFSPNHETEGHEEPDGIWVVHRITSVRSVDLVAEPATNRNLQEGAMDPELDDISDGGGDPEKHLGKLISALCADTSLDKAAKKKKVLKALDLYDEPEGDGAEEMDLDEDGGDMVGDDDEMEGDGDEREGDKPEDEPEWMGRDEEEDDELMDDESGEKTCTDCGAEMVNGVCPSCAAESKKVAKESKGIKAKAKARVKESIGYARQLARSKDPRTRRLAESLLRTLSPQPPRRAGRAVREEVDRSRGSRRPQGRRRVQEAAGSDYFAYHPDAKVRQLAEQYDGLRLEVDELRVAGELEQRGKLAMEMCRKAKLPKRALTEDFVGLLMDADSPKQMRRLIEDRRLVAGVQAPVYPGSGRHEMKDEDFLRFATNGR